MEAMDDARPSLARRAVAALVLVVVAVVAVRLVIGVISAVVWIVALVALVIAALWAWSTLRAGKRRRQEKKTVKPSPAAQVPAPAPEDRVEAEMRKIREQLREQGRG